MVRPTRSAPSPARRRSRAQSSGSPAPIRPSRLTGDTREHALVFVFGPGGNGKSVAVNVQVGIMGDYATTAAMDVFIASAGDRHPADLAMLRGSRLVTASETEEGRQWAESRIKQLTGGDRITARFMRQDFFTFLPSFKLQIIGNHKPGLRNIDDAARRRFNLVPFVQTPAVPDRQLEEKLKAEWPGILRWMVDGCLAWQRDGLVRPASITTATEAYFADQDRGPPSQATLRRLLAERIAQRPCRAGRGPRSIARPRGRCGRLGRTAPVQPERPDASAPSAADQA